MNLLIWKNDRSQAEIQATGGYAFTKGDVLFAQDAPFDPLWLASPNFVSVSVTTLPSIIEALLMTALYGATRQREYYVLIDNLNLAQPVDEVTLINNIVKK